MPQLSDRHREDLRLSGLSDDTIEALGFYSGNESQVRRLLGFGAGAGLVIPYQTFNDLPFFCRVKPDSPLALGGRPAKYLSPKGALAQAYIPPRTWEALQYPERLVLFTEGEKKIRQGRSRRISLHRARWDVWFPGSRARLPAGPRTYRVEGSGSIYRARF